MKRYFENEKHLKFKDINGEFVIREIVGRGASCVVYRADFYNEFGRVSEHLLKEYNPKDINMCRDDEDCLLVNSESDMKKFEQGLSNFIEGYKKQELLRRNAELKNYTANVQNLYEGYGTIFIDMNVTEGMSYANVTEKSLYNLAKRMKVLAQVVGEYHRNGYLHLDLKPNNIYVRPEKETCEDVLLFDFDSLIRKEDIVKGTRVSYTDAWAPLELTSSSRRGLICEATDVFSLGEIFFEKLMGRHSGIRERRSFSKYEYDFESDILKNVNPKVTVLLDELFRKTLCNTVSERYQSVDSLVTIFEEIIKISNPNEPYLKSSCPEPQEFFIGRDKELSDIHSMLMESKVLFLSGMGGIGKSELAKNYAKLYKDDYDVVVFVPYVSNLISAFGSDEVFPIYNVFKYPEEKMDEYCKRKFRKIKELCDERTLIIVDNFDLTEDDMLEEILKFNCKILFTTRKDFSEYNRTQKVIDTIEDKNVQVDIFKKYYTKELSDTDELYVKEIIEIVAGHTMTIELLAKQMMAGRVKPDKMLERLKETGISESGNEKVAISKDDKLRRGSAYEHIRVVFDLAELNEEEKNILSNLALMPYTGVLTELFVEWCGLAGFEVINRLVLNGWITNINDKKNICLHPIISEMVLSNVDNIECNWKKMFKYIINDVLPEEKNYEYVMSICEHILSILYKRSLVERMSDTFIRSVCGYHDIDKGEVYLEYVVSIRKSKLGIEHDETIVAMKTLAYELFNNYKWHEARTICEKILKIIRKKYVFEHNAFKNNAIYRECTGMLIDILIVNKECAKALKLIKKHVNFCYKYRHERRNEIDNLYRMADYGLETRKYDFVLECCELALEKLDDWSDNTETIQRRAGVYCKLHSYYVKTNDKVKVYECINKVLLLFEQSDGYNSTNYLIALNMLCKYYIEFGIEKDTIKYLDEAYKLAIALYGPSHGRIAHQFIIYSRYYEKCHDFDRAIKYANMCIERLEPVFEPTNKFLVEAKEQLTKLQKITNSKTNLK